VLQRFHDIVAQVRTSAETVTVGAGQISTGNANLSQRAEEQASGLEENVAAALCYLVGVLTGILFLVIEPYNRNPTIRFHAFQSIFAWIAAMSIGMGLSLFSYPISALPFIGWIIDILLWLAFSLGVLVLWLFLMYKAYNRERVVLPVIGVWAEKQAHSVKCSSTFDPDSFLPLFRYTLRPSWRHRFLRTRRFRIAAAARRARR
jgi:uncharacterized membrane protein